MGLIRTYPERRQDIKSLQNGKLLLSEKRALKLMGESVAVVLRRNNRQFLCVSTCFGSAIRNHRLQSLKTQRLNLIKLQM